MGSQSVHSHVVAMACGFVRQFLGPVPPIAGSTARQLLAPDAGGEDGDPFRGGDGDAALGADETASLATAERVHGADVGRRAEQLQRRRGDGARYSPRPSADAAEQRQAATPTTTRIAVARADGAIAIVVPHERWAVERRVPGRADTPVTALLWLPGDAAGCGDGSTATAPQPRLFGASLRGVIFEIDLRALALRSAADALGGAVWSLAADAHRMRIAAACEDGTVRLFRANPLDGGGGLEYERTISVVGDGHRVLSLAWYVPPPLQTRPRLSRRSGAAATTGSCTASRSTRRTHAPRT